MHNRYNMLELLLEQTNFMTWASIVSLILGTVLILYYIRSKRLLDEMWEVDNYDARELKRMCTDGFKAIVEVEGIVSCDEPVTAPVSKLPCCWVRTIVECGSDKQWIKAYELINFTFFKITDKTGSVYVNPGRADIEAEEICCREIFGHESWFETVGLPDRWIEGGYRVREEVFLPGLYAFVHGQASYCDVDGKQQVMLQYPTEGYVDPNKKVFIISRKSERELTGSNNISLAICFWGSIAAFFTAAYCFLDLAGVIR